MHEQDGLVRIDVDDIRILKICRRKSLNAINRQLLTDLSQELSVVASDSHIRALVVTAEGESAFCAGADLKERRTMSLEQTHEFVTTIGRVFRQLELLEIPTIAAMNGSAFGGGLELALACDFRVALTGARYGLTECMLGIIPGAGGTQRLPRLIGPSRASEMILTGKVVDAHVALELGLVNYVEHSASSVMARTHQLVEGIRRCAPLSVKAAKKSIHRGFDLSMEDGLAQEFACYQTLIGTEDRVEGLKAFAEKRPPQFVGH
jgi:methylglutaconyl-CoA hydratase